MPNRKTLAVLIVLGSAIPEAAATNCYYPNGDVDDSGVAPCSGDGGACCPLNWYCVSPGFCYLEAEDYYGRYTCTDQTWSESSGCPQYCTQNNTAPGNEALLQCGAETWCCDGNRSGDCCSSDEEDAVFFTASLGSLGSFISTTLPVSPFTSASRPSSTPPATDLIITWAITTPRSDGADFTLRNSDLPLTVGQAPRSKSTSTSSLDFSIAPHEPLLPTVVSDSTVASSTTVITAIATTNSAGLVSTVVLTETITPSAGAVSSSSSDSSNSRTPVTIGLAVGIPIAVIIGAFLAFLYRRRKHASRKLSPSFEPTDMVDMYGGPSPNANGGISEIDSLPVAVGTKPGHQSQVSELSGSHAYPLSPAVSSITSKGEAGGPQHSPVGNHGVRTTGLEQVSEEPHELWGGPIPEQQTRAQDWAHTSGNSIGVYPDHTPYRQSVGQAAGATASSDGQQYTAYRPPDSPKTAGGSGNSSPTDQGQAEGLRVVN